MTTTRTSTTTAAEPLGRPFHIHLGGVGLANLADGIVLGGVPLVAVTLTRSPGEISLLQVAFWLPWLLLGLVGACHLRHEGVALLLGYALEGETEGELVAVAEERRCADGADDACAALYLLWEYGGYGGDVGIERTEPVAYLAEEGEVLEL